jgi:hypothetical protein
MDLRAIKIASSGWYSFFFLHFFFLFLSFSNPECACTMREVVESRDERENCVVDADALRGRESRAGGGNRAGRGKRRGARSGRERGWTAPRETSQRARGSCFLFFFTSLFFSFYLFRLFFTLMLFKREMFE